MKRLLAFVLIVLVLLPLGTSATRRLNRPYWRVTTSAQTNVVFQPPFQLWSFSLRRDFGTDTVSVWFIRPAVTTGRNQTKRDSTLYKLPPNNPTTLPWIVDFGPDGPTVTTGGIRIIKAVGTQVILSGAYLQGGGYR